MAALTLAASTNYSAQSLTNIDTIDFTNVGFPPVTATFAASQFNGAAILTHLTIDGSAGLNRIVVNGGSVNASRWQFRNWDGFDTITLNGGAGNDIIQGSSQRDTITGGNGDDRLFGNAGRDTIDGGANNDRISGGTGNDILKGGEGNDAFLYGVGTELGAGESIDGGGGFGDRIDLAASGAINFAAATLAGVEVLDFVSGVSTASFMAGQIGAALPVVPEILGVAASNIQTVDGSGSVDAIVVSGNNISLAGVSFTNWSATDTITLVGTSGEDYLIGSQQADTFNAGAGADDLEGQGGDDVFAYAAGSEAATGESIDGGGGGDTIALLGAGDFLLSETTIANIEVLDFRAGATAFLHANQIGDYSGPEILGGAPQARISVVDGSDQTDHLVVTGGNASLRNMVFTNWSAGDTVILEGTNGIEILYGSQQADTIRGFDEYDFLSGEGGNDVIVGGLGGDQLRGGAGNDTFDYDTKNESLPSAINLLGTSDLIADFEDVTGGANDMIDLSGIDANEAAGGNQAFFLDNGNGVREVGELIVQSASIDGATFSVLVGFTNNDQTADFAIRFDRVITTFGSDDFVL